MRTKVIISSKPSWDEQRVTSLNIQHYNINNDPTQKIRKPIAAGSCRTQTIIEDFKKNHNFQHAYDSQYDMIQRTNLHLWECKTMCITISDYDMIIIDHKLINAWDKNANRRIIICHRQKTRVPQTLTVNTSINSAASSGRQNYMQKRPATRHPRLPLS